MEDRMNTGTILTEEAAKQSVPAGMEEYRSSGYYQNLGIDQLQEQLKGYQTDEAALRQQAESQYKPTYDAELEAIRQQLALQTQGYNSQLAGMGTGYDRQRRKTNQAYDESAVRLNNGLTKRGLGRSSLVSTQGTYLENQRNQALSDIDRDESQAIHAINEKIALLTDQAAQREQTLAGNYARQLENRVNELKEQNRTASVSLQLQIATLQQQGYQAYQDWLLQQQQLEQQKQNADREYELALRDQQLAEDKFAWEKGQSSSSGGGGSGGGTNYPAPDNGDDQNSSDSWLQDLLDGIGGNTPPKTASGVGGAITGALKPTTTQSSNPITNVLNSIKKNQAKENVSKVTSNPSKSRVSVTKK